MEELLSFEKNESRLIDAGLIAISIVILQDWISSGVHDVPSLISLVALSASIPMLTFDLLFAQTRLLIIKIYMYFADISSASYDHLFDAFKSKTKITIFKLNKKVGMLLAVAGTAAAIWHVFWIAGLLFLIIGIISYSMYLAISPKTENLLYAAYKIGEKEGEKEAHVQTKKDEDEYIKDFYYFD